MLGRSGVTRVIAHIPHPPPTRPPARPPPAPGSGRGLPGRGHRWAPPRGGGPEASAVTGEVPKALGSPLSKLSPGERSRSPGGGTGRLLARRGGTGAPVRACTCTRLRTGPGARGHSGPAVPFLPEFDARRSLATRGTASSFPPARAPARLSSPARPPGPHASRSRGRCILHGDPRGAPLPHSPPSLRGFSFPHNWQVLKVTFK